MTQLRDMINEVNATAGSDLISETVATHWLRRLAKHLSVLVEAEKEIYEVIAFLGGTDPIINKYDSDINLDYKGMTAQHLLNVVNATLKARASRG